MEIKISNAEKKLTEEEIRKAEGRVGVKFPDEYRQFLLKYNGGHPEPCAFEFNCEGQESEIAAVAYFLAVYDGDDENFFDYFETYRERIPPELMPVARDPGGSLILLGVAGKHTGKTYFWLQDSEPDEPDFSNVCTVANSFNEFLDSLFDPDA